ncbi:MAG: hypothetical protein ACYC4U_20885 [Pirellulaceae bacterium]
MTKKSIPNDEPESPDDLFGDGPTGAKAPDPAPDPFDPESLRLGQDFASSVGVKKRQTVWRARKPNRQEFVRVRPGVGWRLETACFEDKALREVYIVERSLWADFGVEIIPVVLFTAITRQNEVFLWPCKLPGADGRKNDWNDSAIAAALLAETRWVRMAANMQTGHYDVFEASGALTDPEWPEYSFSEILRLCFQDRFVRSADHPVLKQLRGES